MQEPTQEKRDFLKEGELRAQKWADELLATPEAKARYETISAECEIWLQLLEARQQAGLTQAELAQRLGVSQAQVARIERCGYDAYTLKTLRRHVQALGKTLWISVV